MGEREVALAEITMFCYKQIFLNKHNHNFSESNVFGVGRVFSLCEKKNEKRIFSIISTTKLCVYFVAFVDAFFIFISFIFSSENRRIKRRNSKYFVIVVVSFGKGIFKLVLNDRKYKC